MPLAELATSSGLFPGLAGVVNTLAIDSPSGSMPHKWRCYQLDLTYLVLQDWSLGVVALMMIDPYRGGPEDEAGVGRRSPSGKGRDERRPRTGGFPREARCVPSLTVYLSR